MYKKSAHSIICFVASKSGGHIIPCITMAQELKRKNPSCKILFFTTTATLDTELTQHACIDRTIFLTTSTPTTKNMWNLLRFLQQFCWDFLCSFYYLIKFRPQKIISTGGSISVPFCCAGKILAISIELYELNVLPGKTIKLLAPLAHTIYTCFEQTQKYFPAKKTAHVPYPLRFTNNERISQENAQKSLFLQQHIPTVAILGGSQGSQFLNQLITSYQHNPANPLQFIHQTGTNDQINWQQWYASHHLESYVCTFDHHAHLLYAAADVIICRSGSGTLHEIIFFGKRCITIPLDTATTDHQQYNAHACHQLYPHQIHVILQQEAQQNPQRVWQAVRYFLQAKK